MQVYTSRTITSFQDNAAAYDAHRHTLPALVQGHLHVGAVGVQAGAVRGVVHVHVPVTLRTKAQTLPSIIQKICNLSLFRR